jgi:hypothetical protein
MSMSEYTDAVGMSDKGATNSAPFASIVAVFQGVEHE